MSESLGSDVTSCESSHKKMEFNSIYSHQDGTSFKHYIHVAQNKKKTSREINEKYSRGSQKDAFYKL